MCTHTHTHTHTHILLIFQGCEVLEKVGGLHKFMGWNRALLTVRYFSYTGQVDCLSILIHIG